MYLLLDEPYTPLFITVCKFIDFPSFYFWLEELISLAFAFTFFITTIYPSSWQLPVSMRLPSDHENSRDNVALYFRHEIGAWRNGPLPILSFQHFVHNCLKFDIAISMSCERRSAY
jgi:hypothetical protein